MDNDVLARHHAEIDDRICKLLMRADGGDNHDLAAEWNLLEGELARHFELEEHEVFPLFERENPEEVRALRQEHAALRRDLLALGIRADLHFLRADAVRDFVGNLHAHAEREDETLYRWAAKDLQPRTWAKIAATLTHVGRSVGHAVRDLGSQSL
jgi:hemerythrin-like domain-containing protein